MTPKNMTPHDYRTFLSGAISGLEFARSLSMQMDRKDDDCGCNKRKDPDFPLEDPLPPMPGVSNG